MTFLITGSEGYIGTQLQKRLRATYPDCQIIRVDRKLNVEVGSIRDLTNVDFVIHLAGQPSVHNTDVDKIISDNYNSFNYICNLTNKFQVPLIYASSVTAYEKNPQTIYSRSKRDNEKYATSHYPEAVGLRFSNIYSRKPRKDTIFYSLLNKSQVKLIGKGEVRKHFTTLTNILDSIIYTINNYKDLKGVYNVYNPVSNTIFELAQEVQKYRPNLTLELVDSEAEPEQLIDSTLGTIPITYQSIEEGVKHVFEK